MESNNSVGPKSTLPKTAPKLSRWTVIGGGRLLDISKRGCGNRGSGKEGRGSFPHRSILLAEKFTREASKKAEATTLRTRVSEWIQQGPVSLGISSISCETWDLTAAPEPERL